MTAPSIDITQIPPRFRPAMQALATGAAQLSAALRRHRPGETPPEATADALMREALRNAGLRHYASPALPHPLTLDAGGDLALALDPLSGADQVGSNGAMGTIFGIFAARDEAEASFLRPGRDLLAAGYVMHGPRCCLVAGFGEAVRSWQLDPDSGRFDLVAPCLEMPDCSFAFAIDAADYRRWPRPIRAYIDDCLAGTGGPRARNFSMHWTASLVAETQRILTQGGIFLDPGGLSRLFHALPVAFLVEHAGGRASDGAMNILDAPVASLAETTPLIFGSPEKVGRVAACHDLPEPEVSALFGNRGLFRA